MKYLFVLILFLISNGFGFAQFRDYRPYSKEYIYWPGVYHFSKQKSEPYNYYFGNIFRPGSYLTDPPEYEQYENILFFKNKGGKNLIYDKINHWCIHTDIDNIDSIVFKDPYSITIKGSHTITGNNYWNNRSTIEWVNTISEEINIVIYNIKTNIYHKINVTDEMIGKEIPRNKLEGKSESFFPPVASEDNKYFLFKLFGRNVVFDFTQYKQHYDYIYIFAIYNTTFDEYYIFVDSYAGDH